MVGLPKYFGIEQPLMLRALTSQRDPCRAEPPVLPSNLNIGADAVPFCPDMLHHVSESTVEAVLALQLSRYVAHPSTGSRGPVSYNCNDNVVDAAINNSHGSLFQR